MGIEFELKFGATPAQISAVAAAYPPTASFSMATTYYDTADFALAAKKWTLRLRQENDLTVCTLKTPTAGIGRGEWECQSDCIEAGTKVLCKLGAPAELLDYSAKVHPICGAVFTRQCCTVPYAGATLELAMDQGLLTGAGKEVPLSEIEVELKSGSEAAAIAFAKALSEDFGLKPESKSKFKRALALVEEKIDGL